MPAVPYAAGVYGVSSLVLLPVVLPRIVGLAPPPASTWVALALLGVIPTLVGHTLVQVAARTAPPTLVALVSPGETIGSLAIGAALLRKWPSPVEGVGAAIILAGAVLAIRAAASPTRGPGNVATEAEKRPPGPEDRQGVGEEAVD
jgi:drug/metabolite transporter (DMT)-like permease